MLTWFPLSPLRVRASELKGNVQRPLGISKKKMEYIITRFAQGLSVSKKKKAKKKRMKKNKRNRKDGERLTENTETVDI